MFVDDPRSSLELAAGLVDDSVESIVMSVKEQQHSLLSAWQGTGIAVAVTVALPIYDRGKRHPARECMVTYLSALDLGGSYSAFREPRLAW
jgi:hypothetical protein